MSKSDIRIFYVGRALKFRNFDYTELNIDLNGFARFPRGCL